MRLITKFFRGNIIENFHISYAVVVNDHGKVIFSAGDQNFPSYIRSAAKPFQAVAMLEAGIVDKCGLTNEELALLCSTHNGEVIHVDLLREMMRKVDITVDDLQCGVHPPIDRSSYEQLILQGKRPTTVHNACSGTHIGMIAMAKAMDVAIENYNLENHPIQKNIFEKIQTYSEMEKIPTAIDNCNSPTYFLPLKNLAIMYKKLIAEEDENLRKVVTAMALNPQHVAGRNRFDTEFIIATGGKGVSKTGDDGIGAIGLKGEDGKYYGAAVKSLSGNREVPAYVIIQILKHLKLIGETILTKLEKYENPVLKNHAGIEYGRVETEIVSETDS